MLNNSSNLIDVDASALATEATLSAISGKVALAANQLSDGHNVTVDNASLVVAATDFPLEVGRGNVTGVMCVSKFGEAPSGIQTTATDMWSRADAATTQQIWLAPTAANRHTIKSSAATDTTNGVGINSVIVYYLPDWDTAETTETVTGDIGTGIQMTASAVMIHRMKVVPQATTTNVGGNVGTITATAAAPSATTITAVILPGEGQTEMAIYGVPSTQDFYLTRWGVNIDKVTGAVASADFIIRVNPNPNVQAIGSAADIDGHSGFDGYLVTK